MKIYATIYDEPPNIGILMYAKVLCQTLRGINGVLTYVEADSSNGLPNFSMVGNLTSSVKEAGDRVRTALKNSDVEIPAKKVTINIAPADMRKDGSVFDLPIAVAILKSLELISKEVCDLIDDYAFVGELNLNGDIVGIRGILPLVSGIKEQGIKGVFVPRENEQEALVVNDIDIISVGSIRELLDILKSTETFNNCERPSYKEIEEVNSYPLDFSDINGQEFLKRACEVAVAGFHNIIISGSAGTGKTMIAKRIPTIMPKLTLEEAVEITKVYSVAGELKNKSLMTIRPFRNPHHSISVTSLIGGGIYPHPGEISLASNGVLFLDELPHFSKIAIETLREPLEEKKICISRLSGTFSYPANFMLVGAMNKVMACLIPHLKIPLIIGDFIFAMSAYFSIFIILNVHRVALGVATGLHFRVAVGVAVGLHRVAGVARFLGLCGKLCFLNDKNCSKRLFKLNNKEIV